MNFNLPEPPDNHRWYLAKNSNQYACLKLQKRTWYGWVTVASEMVCITERQFPLDVAMKSAANDVIRVLDAPKVNYGVVT